MKTIKNLKVTAIFLGIEKVNPLALGNKKYIGYDYLFGDIEFSNGFYKTGRAKKIGVDLKKGMRVSFECSFKSRIISNIKNIKIT